MSRRSRARRKLARQIFRSSRSAPRAIAAALSTPARGYPRAHDLLASGQGWREFLETALREVLRPVALVSAVGLAGCGAQAHAPAIGSKPSEAQGSGTGAVLVPMPPSGGGSQRVVTGSLPPPVGTSTTTPVVQTTHVPAVHHPQGGTLRGTPNVVPIPTPLAVRGEMTSVTPVPPTPDPIPLGGAPMPVLPDPPQPPQPQPPQPPQPQVNPQPDPPPMPGGMAIVVPQPPPTPVAGS